MWRTALRILATAVVVVAAPAGSGLAAGAGTDAASVGSPAASGDLGRTTDGPSYSTGGDIVVTQEYRLTPDEPGRIDVRWRFEKPLVRVEEVRTLVPQNATDVRSDAFEEVSEDVYEWSGEGTSASITFTLPVNRTNGDGSGGYTFVDTGDWALIQRPPTPKVGYRYRGSEPEVRHRTTLAGEGVVGTGLLFLGPHEVHERTAHGQTFRLVVPEAATLAEQRADVFGSVTDAADRLRVGDRDDTVVMVAAPTNVSWAVSGRQHGDADFYVRADQVVDAAGNTWVHEYVHTRQAFNHTDRTEWFVEGSAEYYAALVTLEQGRIGYDAFRGHLLEGTRGRHDGARLVAPGTWGDESDYEKGALVAGELDRQIRLASDGEATLQDVFGRLNRDDRSVPQSEFLGAVREAGNDTVADLARRYTETTDSPPMWFRERHRAAFGPLPPAFRYEPPENGGVRVRGPYRNGTLDEPQLVVGETLVLDIRVTNDGGPGEYDLPVTLDGEPIATRTGRLDAGEATVETVEHTFTEPGVYDLRVADDRATLEVQRPAGLLVTDAWTNRSRVRPGGTVSVAVAVENFADRPGRERIVIRQNGTELAAEEVQLPAGGRTEVTATAVLPEEGDVRFTAGDKVAVVSVAERATPTDDPGRTDADDGTEADASGASGSGFGTAAALFALAAALLAATRTR